MEAAEALVELKPYCAAAIVVVVTADGDGSLGIAAEVGSGAIVSPIDLAPLLLTLRDNIVTSVKEFSEGAGYLVIRIRESAHD